MPLWAPLGGIIGTFAVIAGQLFVDGAGVGRWPVYQWRLRPSAAAHKDVRTAMMQGMDASRSGLAAGVLVARFG